MNNIDMEKLGYNNFFKERLEKFKESDKYLVPGRVSAVHKEKYMVFTEKGEKWASLKGSFFYSRAESILYPTTGDFVA